MSVARRFSVTITSVDQPPSSSVQGVLMRRSVFGIWRGPFVETNQLFVRAFEAIPWAAISAQRAPNAPDPLPITYEVSKGSAA